ncbi:MAG: hypothetical protein Q3988_05265 [Gemella sp.]|nr:hypothetical protein [Gemella sp.]
MKEFTRKWEKRIAWTANIIFVLWFMLFGYLAFISEDTAFISGLGLQIGVPGHYMQVWLQATVGGAIVFFILAVVATLLMKRRILSGIIFLITAIITGNSGFGLIVVAILYFIVAIMLFVRKERIKE